jgi:hypothetical protein
MSMVWITVTCYWWLYGPDGNVVRGKQSEHKLKPPASIQCRGYEYVERTSNLQHVLISWSSVKHRDNWRRPLHYPILKQMYPMNWALLKPCTCILRVFGSNVVSQSFHVNLLKPTGYVMHQQLNLQEPCVLYIGRAYPTLQMLHSIYIFNKYKYWVF